MGALVKVRSWQGKRDQGKGASPCREVNTRGFRLANPICLEETLKYTKDIELLKLLFSNWFTWFIIAKFFTAFSQLVLFHMWSSVTRLYAGPKIQVFGQLKKQTYAGSLKMVISFSFIFLESCTLIWFWGPSNYVPKID